MEELVEIIVDLPEETICILKERATKLNITVNDLVLMVLEQSFKTQLDQDSIENHCDIGC